MGRLPRNHNPPWRQIPPGWPCRMHRRLRAPLLPPDLRGCRPTASVRSRYRRWRRRRERFIRRRDSLEHVEGWPHGRAATPSEALRPRTPSRNSAGENLEPPLPVVPSTVRVGGDLRFPLGVQRRKRCRHLRDEALGLLGVLGWGEGSRAAGREGRRETYPRPRSDARPSLQELTAGFAQAPSPAPGRADRPHSRLPVGPEAWATGPSGPTGWPIRASNDAWRVSRRGAADDRGDFDGDDPLPLPKVS